MGTHCIITKKENPTLGIYIHYDGYDKAMVEDIVKIAKDRHARNVNDDEEYGIARLACACETYYKNETTGFGVVRIPYGDYNYHWVINPDWSVEQVYPPKNG